MYLYTQTHTHIGTFVHFSHVSPAWLLLRRKEVHERFHITLWRQVPPHQLPWHFLRPFRPVGCLDSWVYEVHKNDVKLVSFVSL